MLYFRIYIDDETKQPYILIPFDFAGSSEIFNKSELAKTEFKKMIEDLKKINVVSKGTKPLEVHWEAGHIVSQFIDKMESNFIEIESIDDSISKYLGMTPEFWDFHIGIYKKWPKKDYPLIPIDYMRKLLPYDDWKKWAKEVLDGKYKRPMHLTKAIMESQGKKPKFSIAQKNIIDSIPHNKETSISGKELAMKVNQHYHGFTSRISELRILHGIKIKNENGKYWLED